MTDATGRPPHNDASEPNEDGIDANVSPSLDGTPTGTGNGTPDPEVRTTGAGTDGDTPTSDGAPTGTEPAPPQSEEPASDTPAPDTSAATPEPDGDRPTSDRGASEPVASPGEDPDSSEDPDPDAPVDPRAVEALLFLSPDPLPVETLVDVLESSEDAVLSALDRVDDRFDETSGLELARVAGGWTLRTRADLEDVCDRLRERPPQDRLSPAALETLAVVAYLEPVSRPDIGRLRGVSVDSTVASLVERGLLEEAGRADGVGAMRYRTTAAFQRRFGLADSRDLPPIERFELSGAQAEDLRRTLIDSGHLAPDTVTADDGDDAVEVLSDSASDGEEIPDRIEVTDESASRETFTVIDHTAEGTVPVDDADGDDDDDAEITDTGDDLT